MSSCRPRLIIVDDSPLMLSGIVRSIQGDVDCDITTFTSAKEALEFISGQAVDVVLSDLEMPEMDGCQFFKELNIMQPHIELILMTGTLEHEFDDDQADVKELAVIVRKPWDRDTLIDTIQDKLKVSKIEL